MGSEWKLKTKKKETGAHFEVVQQVSARDFSASDLFFYQVRWREQRRDEVHQLLLKLLVDI